LFGVIAECFSRVWVLDLPFHSSKRSCDLAGEYGDELGRQGSLAEDFHFSFELLHYGFMISPWLNTGPYRARADKSGPKSQYLWSCRLNPGDVVGEGGALGIAPIRGATVRVRTGGKRDDQPMKRTSRDSLEIKGNIHRFTCH